MLASDPEAGQLTETVRNAAARECGETLKMDCAERLFAALDEVYQGNKTAPQ
jgi:hypothetical protein